MITLVPVLVFVLVVPVLVLVLVVDAAKAKEGG